MKATLSGQRSLHLVLFHLLLFLCHDVAANTEIITFSSSREPPVDLPWDVVGNWSTLHPSDNERRWTLELAALHTPLHQVCERDDDTVASHPPPYACPHELWLLLDLDDPKWTSCATFTLRLSWPASVPADVAITTYSPRDLAARLSAQGLTSAKPEPKRETATLEATRHRTPSSSAPRVPGTRARYARIRAVDTGVPTPGQGPHSPRQPYPGRDAPVRLGPEGRHRTVPLAIILEPSYVGVLPATLLPTVGYLVPIVLAAALCVPWVIAYIEPFVRQVGEDLNAERTQTGKER